MAFRAFACHYNSLILLVWVSIMSDIPYDCLLDASGLNCPLPLLKAKQQLNQLSPGQVLKVVATDQGSVRDFQSYVSMSSHEMLDWAEVNASYIYFIRKG